MVNESGQDKKGGVRRGRRIKKTMIEEIFEQTMQLNMQINAKQEEVEYWRMLATKAAVFLGAVSNGGIRRRSNIEECMCKIMNIEESLKEDMDKFIELKQKSQKIIDKLDVPEYKSLLINRYICGKTWEEVAVALGYSYVHTVNRLQPKAIDRLIEIGAEDAIK